MFTFVVNVPQKCSLSTYPVGGLGEPGSYPRQPKVGGGGGGTLEMMPVCQGTQTLRVMRLWELESGERAAFTQAAGNRKSALIWG